MKTFLLIIFLGCIGFYLFMATPFGFSRISNRLEKGQSCYEVIFIFLTIIPVMIIGCYLGITK